MANTYIGDAATITPTGAEFLETDDLTVTKKVTIDSVAVRAGSVAGTSFGRTLLNAASVAAQVTALSLTIGVNTQAWSAGLDAIAALTTAANKSIYWTALNTPALYDLTAFGRTMAGSADAKAFKLNGEIEKRTTFTGSTYTVLLTDMFVAFTGSGTSGHTVTLPAASSVNPGKRVYVADESGLIDNVTNPIAFAPTGADTLNGINGVSSLSNIRSSFGYAIWTSDGVSKWTGIAPLNNSSNLSDVASVSTTKTNLGLVAIASSGSATDLTTGSLPAARIATGLITDTLSSLANKPAVMAVATTNLTLSGEQTIDGQLSASSIVLLSAQTTGSQNGFWITNAGAWTRPTWYPAGGTSQAFQFITAFVRLGATYQGTTWRLTTAGAITIDTTSQTWTATPHTLNASAVTGILVVANGGTGAATLTGYVKGAGTSALTASATIPTTDITGLATVATSGSAADLSTGTIPAARLGVFSFTYSDTAPVAGTIYLDRKAAFPYTINQIRGLKTASGTATLAVKINGTNVTSLSALAVTSSTQDVTATAAFTVATGDEVTLVWSSPSTPVDACFTLQCTRT